MKSLRLLNDDFSVNTYIRMKNDIVQTLWCKSENVAVISEC